jgi:hypothetical protein
VTRGIRHIDWPALGASVGASSLLTVLAMLPLLMGVQYGYWLLVLVVGIVLGVYLYVRREKYAEPGPDADETRFPPSD